MTEWQDAIKRYGLIASNALRHFGIEITPEEAQDIVREELVNSVRQHIRELFVRMINQVEREE